MAKKLTKKDDKKSKKTEAPKSSLDDLILADGKITAPSEDSDIKKIRDEEVKDPAQQEIQSVLREEPVLFMAVPASHGVQKADPISKE